MKDACTGESPQDADSRLSIIRDSLNELNEVKREISKVSNVGSRIAAGVFNQGSNYSWSATPSQPMPLNRHLNFESPLSPIFFGEDNSRIEKALEAAKYRPYQAATYRSKVPSYFRSSDSQEETLQEAFQILPEKQVLGKSQRPCLQEGGGPDEEVSPLREAGGVVLGLVSLAQTPCPATIPFRSAPNP
jgi:hypothetical protein